MSVIDWSVDRMNPVVLRESRQLVRSRFAVGIMMVFMLVMVLASAIYVVQMGQSSKSNFTHGKNLFNVLYYVLGYATILFIPAHTALPMLGQQKTTGLDLLFVSTIPPRSIILGKMISAVWMLVLLFSVSMPFMVLTVLLRGIGLFEVLLYLAMLAGLVLMATMGFLLLVCLPTNRVFLSLLSIGYVLLLIMFPGLTASFSFRGLDPKFVGGLWVVAVILLPIAGSLATALISPIVSNRALGARVTITVCWIGAGIVAALTNTDCVEAWAYISMFGAAIAMFACTSEPDSLSRRVKHAVPKRRFLRLLAFPFFNGPLSGWVWCWLIGLLTIGSSGSAGEGAEFFSLLLYATLYSLLAVWTRRHTFVGRFCAEKYTWAIAFILILLGIFLPLIANFAVNPNGRPKLLWRLGNPFAALDKGAETHVVYAAGACAVLILMNLRWLIRQMKAFRPDSVEIETTNGAA